MPSIAAVLDLPTDMRKFDASKFDKQPMLVFVYMHGCPYCEVMQPEWRRLKLSRAVNTIAVNHTVLNQLKATSPTFQAIEPRGYPHIQLIKPNTTRPTLYEGIRDVDNFVQFVNRNVKVGLPKPITKTATKPKPTIKPATKPKPTIKPTTKPKPTKP